MTRLTQSGILCYYCCYYGFGSCRSCEACFGSRHFCFEQRAHRDFFVLSDDTVAVTELMNIVVALYCEML